MFAIISKTILFLILFSELCFCFSCNQKSVAVPEPILVIQPSPTVVSNVVANEREFYVPLEDCQKIKINNKRSLCEAIVKDLDLTDQALTSKLTYATRYIDLNNDGRNEVITWVPTSDLGGTSGYPIIIFSQTAHGYQKLWDVDQAWTPILVLKSKSHDWRDIAIQQGGGGAEWLYLILRHNGQSYDIEKSQKRQPKGEILIDKDWNQTVVGPILAQ